MKTTTTMIKWRDIGSGGDGSTAPSTGFLSAFTPRYVTQYTLSLYRFYIGKITFLQGLEGLGEMPVAQNANNQRSVPRTHSGGM